MEAEYQHSEFLQLLTVLIHSKHIHEQGFLSTSIRLSTVHAHSHGVNMWCVAINKGLMEEKSHTSINPVSFFLPSSASPVDEQD